MQRVRRWIIIGIVVVSLVLVIVGMRYIAAPAFIGTPDTVHIVVSEVQPPPTSPGTPPTAGPTKTTVLFDQRFTRQATAIYQQMVSGGSLTTGSSCPASGNGQQYYLYILTFFHLGLQVAQATDGAVGCQSFIVVYPGGGSENYSWIGANHVSFWIRLHQLTNAPEPIGICQTMPECHS